MTESLTGVRQWIESRPRVLLALVLLLALGVRLVRIDSRGLTYDDTFSVFLSMADLDNIVRGTAADTMPPLYYFLLHFWMQAGMHVWYLRLLSVGFSLLAVYLLYRWLWESSGSRAAALCAALLMAVSPFQYYHAQDLRNYALLLAGQLGVLLFFSRLDRSYSTSSRPGIKNWFGFTLCSALTMYTHNVAVLFLVLLPMYAVISRKWKLLLGMLPALAAVGILALPWLIQFPQQLSKVQRAWWLWPPGLIDLLQLPVVWTAGLPLPGIWLAVGLLLGIEILALVVVESWRARKRIDLSLSVFIVVGLPMLFFIASYLTRPIFVPRGFILAGAAYLSLVSAGVVYGWRGGAGKLLLAGAVLAAAVGLPAQAGFDQFPRSPFETAAKSLAASAQDGEIVLHDNKLSYFPMRFYQPQLPQTFLPDQAGSPSDNLAYISQEAMGIFPAADLPAAVAGHPMVVYVVFTRVIDEYRGQGFEAHPGLAYLDEHFHLDGQEIYGDLEVYHYSRP